MKQFCYLLKYIPLALFIQIISIVSTGPQQVMGLPLNRGDYVETPLMELSYTGLEAQIEVGFQEGTIRGSAVYRFRPKHAHVETVSWLAAGMEIHKLEMNGRQMFYRLEGDSLVIPFESPPDPEEIITVTISYETKPVFGVHFGQTGTVFSSTLPASVSHWLPGPVHPRITMPVRMQIDVPEGLTAVASGVLDRQDAIENGHRYTFVSENQIPLSDLFFAAGDFAVEESFSGTKNLRIYQEAGTLDENRTQELLSFMVQRTRELERYFRSELPVSAFHAVILTDDRWETRPYAAGVAVFSYGQGQCETLISRALSAQWFGISLRPERWQDTTFFTLLQAMVAEETGERKWPFLPDPLEAAFRIPDTIYRHAEMEQWAWAREFIRTNRDPVLIDALRSLVRDFSATTKTMTSSDFSRAIYDMTGRWIDPPVLTEPEPDPDYRYRIVVDEVRSTDLLSLNITPAGDVTEKELKARINWIRDGNIHGQSFSFKGTGDHLEIATGGRTSNVWISSTDDTEMAIELEKPLTFWLYQLRTDENSERRKEAALALKSFASDPDLQLAVQDLLIREQDTEVLAAMHRLIAELTSGASGTERRFLDGITSPHSGIRLESMKALKAYSGNTTVQNQVFSVIQGSDDIELVNEAIRTYRYLIEKDEFRDFAVRFLREDRQEQLFTKTLLHELFQVPADERSVYAAAEYLNQNYPFDIRWLAYRQLRQHAPDREWQSDFLKDFSNDPDPRIRFIALFSISQLNLQDRGPFLESRMLVEYDIRILQQASVLASTE